MSCTLLLGRQKAHHNSIVTLLGAIEREGLADSVDVSVEPWEQIVAAYEEAASEDGRSCIVGFSLATPDVPQFEKLAVALRRRRRPGDLIIAGGPHATAADADVLALGVDAVFRGEGDLSFPRFVRAVVEQRDWRDGPGLSFLDHERIVRRPAAEPIPIDQVRSRFKPLALVAPLELTRGCGYGCAYCQTPRFWHGKPRHRSLESTLEHLADYRGFVRFVSPNAFGYEATRRGEPNQAAIVGLLEAVRTRYPELQIQFGVFPSEIRPEYVRRELVRAIRPRIANRYLAIGAQSGSDSVLARARRGHTAADVLRAAEIIRGEGMDVLVDILFGLPGETADDVRKTCDLMATIAAAGGRFRVHLFTPLPGTPFADQPLAPSLDAETLAFLDALARQGKVEGNWRNNVARASCP
jgi:B12-binding domain/radical SAM domain protein